MGLQRQFERNGKKGYLTTEAEKPKTLEATNERLLKEDNGVILHATKGWRKTNIKRDRAQFLMAQMRAKGAIAIHNLEVMRHFLKTGSFV